MFPGQRVDVEWLVIWMDLLLRRQVGEGSPCATSHVIVINSEFLSYVMHILRYISNVEMFLPVCVEMNS